MGREARQDASVFIRKEGPTLSYLIPLFVFYTGSDPSYTRCLLERKKTENQINK